MNRLLIKICQIVCCLMLSILLHLLFFKAIGMFGPWDLSRPVNSPLTAYLAEPDSEVPATFRSTIPEKKVLLPKQSVADENDGAAPESASSQSPQPESGSALNVESPSREAGLHTASQEGKSRTRLENSDFLSSPYEKLTYVIGMFGAPVGSAELEARDDNGEVVITLRIRSNELFSAIYPVNNFVQTRHVGNRFIMTTINQHEGNFRSEALFTINPERRRVTWNSPQSGVGMRMTVPVSDVYDTLSAVYSLRNRQLQVGRTETLHVFDSEIYADVPVEILRREELVMPNLRRVATLLLRPQQQTAGLFRRSGELLIWVTDDDKRVPVKFVTTIALGTVTAELVSAESKPVEQIH
ncbi:MAG: DUF3108 domain-containing protein [Geobacteraceae bacterium]|nr:DUF3108 domain-containing protein [Geobacteraceae bacterium]